MIILSLLGYLFNTSNYGCCCCCFFFFFFLNLFYSLFQLARKFNHSVPLTFYKSEYIFTYIMAGIGLKEFPTLEE